MTTAIEAARAALSRAMEGSDRTAVTEAARRLGFAEGVEAAAEASRAMSAVWRSIEDDPLPYARIVLLGWRRWYDGDWMMEAGPAFWGEREGTRSGHGQATHWISLDAAYEAGRALTTGAGDAAEERGDG